MEITDVLRLIQLGKELGYTTIVTTSNILGKSKVTIDYDNYKINGDKLFYNNKYMIYTKDIIAVELGV